MEYQSGKTAELYGRYNELSSGRFYRGSNVTFQKLEDSLEHHDINPYHYMEFAFSNAEPGFYPNIICSQRLVDSFMKIREFYRNKADSQARASAYKAAVLIGIGRTVMEIVDDIDGDFDFGFRVLLAEELDPECITDKHRKLATQLFNLRPDYREACKKWITKIIPGLRGES